jgi:hypothetical protein
VGVAAPSSNENSPMCLHLSGAMKIKTRACGAFFSKSFNVIKVLCKSGVKYAALFCCGDMEEVLRGFLFVFPKANLYNAARLAGRVSFEVIFTWREMKRLFLNLPAMGIKVR